QLARALGLVVEAAGLGVFGDIGVDQEQLAVLGVGVGFRDGRLAGAQRLDLRAHQHDAGLERLVDRIGVARLAGVRDDLGAVVFFLGHGTLRSLIVMAPPGR